MNREAHNRTTGEKKKKKSSHIKITVILYHFLTLPVE